MQPKKLRESHLQMNAKFVALHSSGYAKTVTTNQTGAEDGETLCRLRGRTESRFGRTTENRAN
jgi:hypothetical protein